MFIHHINYNGNSDEALMNLLIKKADKVAFETLYNRYAAKLTAFCKRLLSSTEAAEDTVHEVFIKIIEKPYQFDTSLCFSTWIYTITHRLCLNAIRNEQNRSRLLDLHYETEYITTLQHRVDSKSLKEKINQLYGTLSQKEQHIFLLRFEHQLPLKEIATVLDIPEGTVKSCIFYLLKKISSQLKPYLIS
jgi:RNA polymerase sigma-70 factor, ECF subfamily